jgi:hypothetical protein
MISESLQIRIFKVFILMTPLLINPFSGLPDNIKLLMFFLASFFYFTINKLKKDLNPIFKYSIASLIALGGISTMLSTNIYLSFWGSPDRCFGFFLFLLTVFLALGLPKIKSSKLFNILISSGVIVSIIALLLGIFVEASLFEGRIAGTLGNPNLLGQFLLVPLFLTIYKLLKKRKKSDLLLIIPQALALILSGNRASIFALIIVTFLYLISSKKSWKILASFATIFGGICLILIKRILSFESIQTRLELYESGTKALTENPLWGVGFEQIQHVLQVPETYTLVVDRVHQPFLDLALMGGIPFMISILILIGTTLFILLKKEKALGFALLGLLISLQFNFMGVMDMILFGIFIGVAINSTKKPL